MKSPTRYPNAPFTSGGLPRPACASVALSTALLVCSASSVARAQESRPHRLPIARVGERFEYAPAVQGLVEPVRYQWKGDLPAGIRSDGPRLTGTPSKPQPTALRIELSLIDAVGTKLQQAYQLDVRPALQPLRWVTRALPDLVVGRTAEIEIAVTGGEGAVEWTAASVELPAGLSLETGEDRRRCVIRGVPKRAGTMRLTVRADDESGSHLGPTLFEGRVSPALALPLALAPHPLPPAVYRQPFHHTFVPIGGVPPYRWQLEAQPGTSSTSWLHIDRTNGILNGTPTSLCNAEFTITLTDSQGTAVRTANTLLSVQPPEAQPLNLHPTQLPRALSGRTFHAALHARNARGSITWAVTGAPAWMRLSTNQSSLEFSGTPTAAGTTELTVAAEDRLPSTGPGGTPWQVIGSTDPIRMTVTVEVPKPDPAPLTIMTRTLPDALAGVPYRIQIATSGGEGSVRFEAVELPSWCRLSPAGELGGQPPEAATQRIRIQATDTRGVRADSPVLEIRILGVARPELDAPESINALATTGQPFRFQLPVAGGLRPYRGTISAPLPPGIDFDPAALVFAGTPTQPGEHALQVAIASADAGASARPTRLNLAVVPSASQLRSRNLATGAAGVLVGALLAITLRPRRQAAG